MMFTWSQFLSCSGFLGFLKVIKGDWQEMLPGTWSVLIDGSGSAVLSQAAGQTTARGSSSPALGCRPCRHHLLPGAVGWGEAEGAGGCAAAACSLALAPSSPTHEACLRIRRVTVRGRSAWWAGVSLARWATGTFPCSNPPKSTPLRPSLCRFCLPRTGSAGVVRHGGEPRHSRAGLYRFSGTRSLLGRLCKLW